MRERFFPLFLLHPHILSSSFKVESFLKPVIKFFQSLSRTLGGSASVDQWGNSESSIKTDSIGGAPSFERPPFKSEKVFEHFADLNQSEDS